MHICLPWPFICLSGKKSVHRDKFTKPNWDNIMTKRDKPAMSEEEFEEAIKDYVTVKLY